MEGEAGATTRGPTRIESVRIRGFRSLRDVELKELPQATVLIGANGSGKSNFIRFFEMLSWMARYRGLGEFVQLRGGAGDQLFLGSHVTSRIEAEMILQTHMGVSKRTDEYRLWLAHASPDRFFFADESVRFKSVDDPISSLFWHTLGSGHNETILSEAAHSSMHAKHRLTASIVLNFLRGCSAFQFHDTSANSGFKTSWDATDNAVFRSDGGNLAAILCWLEKEDSRRYELICKHIARVLPVFDRFVIIDLFGKVQLRWKAKGTDKTFGAHLTSDGSLRFFALVTLLNLPTEMLPDVILLDEPELGLHPSAVDLIGSMIKSVAAQRQVIVATQSPLLVDVFDLKEICVLELKDGATELQRLSADEYQLWLDEGYTAGELWQKNLLGGRP